MGAASLKMNRKMAASPTMLLQPHMRMMSSIGFSSASRMLNFFRDLAGAGFCTGPVRSAATEGCPVGTAGVAMSFIGAFKLAVCCESGDPRAVIAAAISLEADQRSWLCRPNLLQRHKAFLLDDLLACRGKNPLNVSFDLARRLAGRVEIEFAGDGVLSIARHIGARLNGRFTFLGRDLEPVHFINLVAHAAIAHA